jgi:hypothetical protein
MKVEYKALALSYKVEYKALALSYFVLIHFFCILFYRRSEK